MCSGTWTSETRAPATLSNVENTRLRAAVYARPANYMPFLVDLACLINISFAGLSQTIGSAPHSLTLGTGECKRQMNEHFTEFTVDISSAGCPLALAFAFESACGA